MEKLINLTFALLITMAVNTTGYCAKNEHIKTEKDRIEVVFNRKMNFNDLVKIKLDLAEKGITITYRMLKFDMEGGLESLNFSVDFHDGMSGSAWKNQIYNNTRFGFVRDYSKDAKIPLAVGSLE